MRNSRPRGPPSTLSGSSSSGRELVAGPYIARGHPPAVFVPGDQDKVTAKNRTKIIIILGIALPVLACIIGIAAWAVTTDVLRISPRAHDNPFSKFGHQGKTRIDSLQPRNDQDIDVFQLNDISAKLTTVRPIIMKIVTQKALLKTTNVPKVESVNARKTSENQKVSDILSRLISDMPIPKNPKDFVVFAPVADMPDEKDIPKGRRLDGKIVLHEDEDLLAEESVHSEEFSQEIPERNTHFSRKRKSSRESSFFKPIDIKSSDSRQNLKLKSNRIPHAMRDNSGVETHPDFLKIHNQNQQTAAPFKSSNTISNRKEGISHPRQNSNQLYNSEITIDTAKKQDLIHHAVSQKAYPDDHPQLEQININTVSNQQQSSHPSQISRLPPNQVNSAYKITVGNTPQNKGSNNFPSLSSQNLPRSDMQHQLQQPPVDQQRKTHHQSYSYQNPSPAPGRQRFHKPPPILGQNSPPVSNTQALPSQNHHQYQPREYQQPPPPQGNPVSHHQASQPQGYHSPPPQNQAQYPNQLSSANNFGNNLPHASNSMSMDQSNNGPQYFAPPPQTFHTKTSYDRPSSKFSSGSSLASYERLAQGSVDLGKDGHHHHHHHHHHHDPVPSNSDPIGDVNFSDVPRTNDADRLGTIGVGLGGPRGITVQIGGGGGGGGLTGLLPLGALGIAKNIVASLLPRPTLGLNSKVFLGLEVGRGGGLNLMG